MDAACTTGLPAGTLLCPLRFPLPANPLLPLLSLLPSALSNNGLLPAVFAALCAAL